MNFLSVVSLASEESKLNWSTWRSTLEARMVMALSPSRVTSSVAAFLASEEEGGGSLPGGIVANLRKSCVSCRRDYASIVNYWTESTRDLKRTALQSSLSGSAAATVLVCAESSSTKSVPGQCLPGGPNSSADFKTLQPRHLLVLLGLTIIREKTNKEQKAIQKQLL